MSLAQVAFLLRSRVSSHVGTPAHHLSIEAQACSWGCGALTGRDRGGGEISVPTSADACRETEKEREAYCRSLFMVKSPPASGRISVGVGLSRCWMDMNCLLCL